MQITLRIVIIRVLALISEPEVFSLGETKNITFNLFKGMFYRAMAKENGKSYLKHRKKLEAR